VWRPLLIALGLAVAGTTVARAEHRVYYRYVVLGWAGDREGRPLARQPVTLVRDKTGLAYQDETNDAGFYLIVARLDDHNVGERLTLRIGPVETSIVARFDPQNHVDERGTRVDLVAGRPIERAAWFASTLRRVLGAR
jgi:hypothetical protein